MPEPVQLAVSSGRELLNALRLRTAGLHRKLDERITAHSILTRDGYLRFLTMHARVLPAAELWLSSRREFLEMPTSRDRLRTLALDQDFEELGLQTPKPQNMSFLNETTSVAGICYVLEGSRLGGAFLARLLCQNGSSHPVNFLSHGQEKQLWSTFLAWLSACEISPANIRRATETAENMFDAYMTALE